MCGRFTLRTSLNLLLQQFAAEAQSDDLFSTNARYNIAPTQDILAIRGVEGRHGDSRSVEYRAWQSMMKKRQEVCGRWARYRNFLADIGRKPGPKCMLVRLDKALPYEPGNLRWLSATEASIRRQSIYITYNGTTLNIDG